MTQSNNSASGLGADRVLDDLLGAGKSAARGRTAGQRVVGGLLETADPVLQHERRPGEGCASRRRHSRARSG